LIGYSLYSRAHFGDAFEFEKAASGLWNNHLTYPFHSVLFDVRAMEKYASPLDAFRVGLPLDAVAPLCAIGVLVVLAVKWARDRRWTLPALAFILGAAINLSVMDAWGEGDARFFTAMVTVWLVAAVIFERMMRRRIGWVVAVLALSAAVAVYVEVCFHMVYWFT
jgi:hypothetical protein